MTTVTTPWGRTRVVEEVSIAQPLGERKGASLVQLLENERGERLVRFAYSTDGSARRGPVTFRARDLRTLRARLEKAPELRTALFGDGP